MFNKQTEQVVLLDEQCQAIGVADKAEVHHQSTPLHLAFSCYIINADGKLLITRRALSKVAWPGVWTNSVCGHPMSGEAIQDAVERRARQELGAAITGITLALPTFRYYAVDYSGVAENEFCPVFVAQSAGEINPNPDEVMDCQWVDPAALRASVFATPWAFSPWMAEQFPLLLKQTGGLLCLNED